MNGLYPDTITKMSSRTARQCVYNVSSLGRLYKHDVQTNKE